MRVRKHLGKVPVCLLGDHPCHLPAASSSLAQSHARSRHALDPGDRVAALGDGFSDLACRNLFTATDDQIVFSDGGPPFLSPCAIQYSQPSSARFGPINAHVAGAVGSLARRAQTPLGWQ